MNMKRWIIEMAVVSLVFAGLGYAANEMKFPNGIIAGTMTVDGGSITDSSGAISFGNENLSTTGTLGAGASTLSSVTTNTISHAGDITITSTGAGVNVNIDSTAGDDFAVDTNKLVVEGDTGRVGIGTTSPYTTLHVDGSFATTKTTITSDQTSYDVSGISFIAINSASNAVTLDGFSNGTEGQRLTIGKYGATAYAVTIKGASGSGTQKIWNLINDIVWLGADYGKIDLIYAGSNRWVVDTTDNIAVNSSGNVGIGTASPSRKLHVYGGASGAAAFPSETVVGIESNTTTKLSLLSPNTAAQFINFGDPEDTDVGIIRYDHPDNSMKFYTNTAEAVRITSSGNVGIGTTTPGDTLDVRGTLSITDADVSHPATAIVSNANAYFNVSPIHGTIGGADVRAFADTDGINPLRITGAFGVTDPTDTVAGISMRSAKSNGSDSLTALGTSETLFQLLNWTTARLTVLGGGNVGIGTTSPANKLDVEGGAVIGATYSGTQTAPSNGLLVQGNVGIGTASPAQLLELNSSTPYMRISDTKTNNIQDTIIGGIEFETADPTLAAGTYGSTIGAAIKSMSNTSNGSGYGLGFYTTYQGDVSLREQMHIDHSGKVGIGTSTPTELLDVNSDAIRIRTSQTPATASATCTAGTVCWDSGYVYICVATNTWKRAELTTW